MRSLFVAAVVICVAQSLIAQDVNQHQLPKCETCSSSGLWGSVDVVSWTPHMRGLDFAATEDGSALSIGVAQIHEADLDRDVGFRTQLGYNTSVGWGIGFGYTHFGTEGTSTVPRPPGAGQLFATYSHPGGPSEANNATSTASLDFNVLDVVARRGIVDAQFVSVTLFGGVRWADIGQELSTQFDGRDFTNGIISSSTDLNAFGLRFGGEAHWRMANGWSAFGNASGAALYGKFDNRRFESNFDGAQVLVDLRDSFVQPVFNLDTALGVAWQHNGWQLSGGYELNVWTNFSESLRFVDDIEQGGLTSLSGDLLLEGFFFRIAKTW